MKNFLWVAMFLAVGVSANPQSTPQPSTQQQTQNITQKSDKQEVQTKDSKKKTQPLIIKLNEDVLGVYKNQNQLCKNVQNSGSRNSVTIGNVRCD
jgi:hypothetical protein